MYSYGHPGSFNPAVRHNEQRNTNMNKAAGFHKETSRNFLPHQPVVLVKCKGQTEALTPYSYFTSVVQLKIYINVDSF